MESINAHRQTTSDDTLFRYFIFYIYIFLFLFFIFFWLAVAHVDYWQNLVWIANASINYATPHFRPYP